MRLLLTKDGCYSASSFIQSLAIDPAILMLVYLCNLWIPIASFVCNSWILAFTSSWMKDERREEEEG